MDPDPTTARLATGRVARLRSRHARTAERPGASSAVPFAAPAADASGPKDLSDLSVLAALLTRHGHAVRVSDRTEPGTVPVAASRLAYLVLEDVVAVLVRRAASDQRIHLRVRTEDGELIVAVQTLPDGDRPKPLALGAHDEATVRRRVEGASGRATIRTTHGGNWLAMARLPL